MFCPAGVPTRSLPLWGFDSVEFESARPVPAWTRPPAYVPWPLPLWGSDPDWTSCEAASVSGIRSRSQQPTARGTSCTGGVAPLGFHRFESARLVDVSLPLWGFGHFGVAVAPLGFRLLVELPLWGFSLFVA